MAAHTILFTDETCLLHDPGPGHPESPARMRAILDHLEHHPAAGTSVSAPMPAPREALLRVHSEEYVSAIDDIRGISGLLDMDTGVSQHSVPVAYLAAGAAIAAVDAVIGGEARHAFSLMRPPGHHAEAAQAMGFCLFNHAAVAAAHAVAAHDRERVLLVDWDVHHGNGTQHIFEQRSDVLYFSAHQYPFYPGTGALTEVGRSRGEGYTVNVPMAAGMNDADYAAVFTDVLRPIAEAYKPDLVVVSAGYDAHRQDPLGGMDVTGDGFAAMCATVCEVAARHAGDRVVLILEGGYDLDGLVQGVQTCIEVMTESGGPELQPPSDRARRLIDQVHECHRAYWPVG